jgi:beta-phosphoglucomutase family hydrolase
MDGVICDNMPAHTQAWRIFFERHGIHIDTRDFLENTMGMPTRDVLSYYFKRPVPASEADEHAAIKEDLYRTLYRPKRRAARGLRRLLSLSRAQRCRIGLGTGSKSDNVTFILDGLRLRPHFDAIVDGADVKKGKPDPETFLMLADKLKIHPRHCIVFEDSLLGEQAATRAGMPVVAVTTSHRKEEFKSAALFVRNFQGLSLSDIFALLPNARYAPSTINIK